MVPPFLKLNMLFYCNYIAKNILKSYNYYERWNIFIYKGGQYGRCVVCSHKCDCDKKNEELQKGYEEWLNKKNEKKEA